MDLFPELDDRERQILNAVVLSYITTAEPVGSRTVVKRFGLDLSAATVRNTMADLEEHGYLQQVHTSSGRVPTDLGYRFYVNYLMQVQTVTETERQRIQREMLAKLNDADEVLRQTSHLLALVSHQAGIAESPSEGDAAIRYLDLIPMGEDRLAVLIADNYGRVRSVMIQLGEIPAADGLTRLTRFLNDHLRGVKVDNLAVALEQKLRGFLDEQRHLAELGLRVLNLVPTHRPGQLFLEGATQLIEQPEFNNVSHVREVFGLLERRDQIAELLRTAAVQGPALRSTILIGSDNPEDGLPGMSLVAAPYEVNGEPVGMIGVLGPRRMPYSRLTGVVEFTAGLVGRMLSRFAR